MPRSRDENGEFIQVFMAHEEVMSRFERFLEENGWELSRIPRFDETSDDYVETHIIVPKNLDQLMKERASGNRD